MNAGTRAGPQLLPADIEKAGWRSAWPVWRGRVPVIVWGKPFSRSTEKFGSSTFSFNVKTIGYDGNRAISQDRLTWLSLWIDLGKRVNLKLAANQNPFSKTRGRRAQINPQIHPEVHEI